MAGRIHVLGPTSLSDFIERFRKRLCSLFLLVWAHKRFGWFLKPSQARVHKLMVWEVSRLVRVTLTTKNVYSCDLVLRFASQINIKVENWWEHNQSKPEIDLVKRWNNVFSYIIGKPPTCMFKMRKLHYIVLCLRTNVFFSWSILISLGTITYSHMPPPIAFPFHITPARVWLFSDKGTEHKGPRINSIHARGI